MSDGGLVLEGGRGRTTRTPPRGVLGYDPSDKESVAWTRELLEKRLGHAPTLVHEEPGWLRRVWQRLRGADT